MRRRAYLTVVGMLATGGGAGCLGNSAEDATPRDGDEPPEGRSQWGYDARNSRYAAGISGPVDEPALQRIDADTIGIPLTADDAYYTSAGWLGADGSVQSATRSVGLDGEVRWNVPTPAESGMVHPALHEDTVVNAASSPTVFWAVSVDDGSEAWQTELSASLGAATTRDWIGVSGDQAYVIAHTGIGCVDLGAREEAWQADLDGQVPFALRGEWRAPVVTPAHVCALNGLHDPERDYEANPRRLYALHPESGALDWTVELELGEPGYGFAHPFAGDRYVFVIANVNEHPEGDADHGTWVRVVAVDPDARDVAWKTTLEGSYVGDSLPAVANGRLYIPLGGIAADDPPTFSALDTADGSVEWVEDTEFAALHPTVTDDLVYAVDRSLRAFDPETGDERWSIDLYGLPGVPEPTEGNVHLPSPPVVHDDRIFVYLHQVGLAVFR